MSSKLTQKTLSLLVYGKLPASKKFAGKHVIVGKNTILPIKDGKQVKKDFSRLKKQYKETPIFVFVPRRDISYVLGLWN